MAQIIWAPKALEDLGAVVEYIARDAPVTARRFGEKLITRVESLKTHPLSGGFIEEDESHTYRQILQGNYRVIYRVADDTVIIVAVHHAARVLDPDDLA